KKYLNHTSNVNFSNLYWAYSIIKTTDKAYITSYYYNALTQPGKFMIVKYDSTGCDTSAFYCATVGIKENYYQAADVSIYPQPANNVLNLSSVLFANKRAQIQISNNLGQLLIKQHLQFNNGIAQLPLANLPKGIYFLKLIDEDLKTFTKKIIVE
ncbi:MAG: T9SS type A sorting domain-containing protein, partial [Chitinophagaceae bacterium]